MIEKHSFGQLADGRDVSRYHLRNKNGLTVDLLDLGCIIQSLVVPGGKGGAVDVVLGYDSVAEYENDDAYLGAVVGRWANRISGAAFELNGGRRVSLAANDGPNHLHGGPGGFHRRLWEAEEGGRNEVIFNRLSPDGEEGYPGNLRVSVAYALNDNDELVFSLEAESDGDTVVNLANHAYFNLSGPPLGWGSDETSTGCRRLEAENGLDCPPAFRGDILGHELRLKADFISEVDSALIPSGRLLPVEGGPFDFRAFKSIGRDIEADHPQIKNGRGYDHNFIVGLEGQNFAEVRSPQSRLSLSLSTTLPGVQFYSGNFLSRRKGKGGLVYGPRSGFCLESQLFPDSVNQPAFPSPVLRKGEIYRHRTSYKFKVFEEY